MFLIILILNVHKTCIQHYGLSVPNANIHLSYRRLHQWQKRRGNISMGLKYIYFYKERNKVSALTMFQSVNSFISLHDESMKTSFAILWLFCKNVIEIFICSGPGTKRERPSEVKDADSAEEESRPEGSQLTPLRKPLPRSPAISTSLKE